MIIKIKQQPKFAIFSRALTAIIGGYILSNLLSILLTLILAEQGPISVTIGLLASFMLYAATVIWVYSIPSIWHVWRTLLIVCCVSALAIYLLFPEQLL